MTKLQKIVSLDLSLNGDVRLAMDAIRCARESRLLGHRRDAARFLSRAAMQRKWHVHRKTCAVKHERTSA